MIRIVPFHHWLLFTRGIEFPPTKSRANLVRLFDNDPDGEANQLWSEYVDWHCNLNPVKRGVSFKTWCKSVREFDNEHERAFCRDIDKDFPPHLFGYDYYVDYLTGLGAVDEAIDAFERLWIKYCNG